jgi:hypothetical protein
MYKQIQNISSTEINKKESRREKWLKVFYAVGGNLSSWGSNPTSDTFSFIMQHHKRETVMLARPQRRQSGTSPYTSD